MPGVTVTATQGDKKVVAVTDSTGAYSFPDLADGVWKVTVEMLTFAPATKDIGVAPNAPPAEWDLKLLSMDEIKSSIQTAPPAAAPSTATPTAAATATGTAAPAAGATGQPAAQTASAAPAAPPAKGKKPAKGTAAPATPQAGFQRTEVNASADSAGATGGAAASAPPPSIASTADATQSADAFVVNGSSSNGIQRAAIGNGRKGPGSLFNIGAVFVLNNSELNARNYSLTGQDTPQPYQNNFRVSANFGGPVYMPHVFRWNNANFFLNWTMNRVRSASNTGSGVMPTTDERAGNFSQVLGSSGSPITLLDPSTGVPVPNNIIPASRISPQAQYLLGFYPLPNFTSAGQSTNYQVPLNSHSSVDAFQARLMKQIDNKNRVNFNGGYQNSRGQTPNVFEFLDGNNSAGFQISGQYFHTFSRTLYGSFTVQYSRQSVLATPFFANKTNVSGLAGIGGNDQTALDWGPPSLGFTSGIFGLSDGVEKLTRNQTTAFTGTVNYTHRPHNFTFGGDWRIQDFSTVGQQNGRGGFTFNGNATGFDFADFLYGIPDASNIAFGNADKYLRAGMYDAYVDDDWRVSPSFSVRLGLRWEYGSPITEEYGRLVNLDIAPGFTASAPVLANNPVGPLTGMRYPSSLVNPDKHAVQPRASFAWKPIFGASTVVRGGYGVYYNTQAYMPMATQMMQQSPLSKSLSVSNSPSDPLTLANGFVASPNTTTDTFALDPHFRVGYAQIWNLSVQQNVSASNLLTVTYTGTKGTGQPQEFLPNTYPIGAINPCPTCLPGYYYLTSNGNSEVEAVQAQLRRRFHGGLQTTFAYTYSKAIDDANPGGSGWTIAQNWLDLEGERGLSNFDQRNLLTASLQYSTGVGVHGGALLTGWRGQVFKGWTILSNINAGSGHPLNPTYSALVPGTGINGTFRPEYTGADIYLSTGGRYLNPAAYAAPPAAQWGNAGRNTIIGPDQFSMNGSMQRSFSDHINIRFDATNVLNHPTFPGWNTTFNPNLSGGGSLFGTRTSPGQMRVIQATVRWTF
jgi:hypothetical protein